MTDIQPSPGFLQEILWVKAEKKNWKRIKDAIAYGSWFSQPQKSCVEILYIRNFAYFHFKHTQKKIQISFQRSCVADGIKDHIRQS